MKICFDDNEDFSQKLLETKMYIRLDGNGQPQLVRVVPVINELGLFNSDKVAVYIDNGQPNFVSRSALDTMLTTSECIAIEEATNWKHKQIH